MIKRSLTRGWVTALSLILMVSTFLIAFIVQINEGGKVVGLKSFNSYEEIRSFVKARADEIVNANRLFYRFSIPLVADSVLGVPKGAFEYSTTNIQVSGVDEADTVKTDGRYIHMVSENSVLIVEAYPPENMRKTTRISVDGYPVGLFINNGRLAVIMHENLPLEDSYYGSWGVSLVIYDVSDVQNPRLVRKISTEGSYVSSRMIGKHAYMVTTKPAVIPLEKDVEVLFPRIIVNGFISTIPADKIFYSNRTEAPESYTIITVADVSVGEGGVESKAVLTGYASCMYVSLSNIYVAMPRWFHSRGESTEIHRIRINGLEIECEASGEVPGRVLNQFSMDEYQGYFRIATTTGYVARLLSEATSANHVYVLNSKTLEIVGRLENLAPGEEIYSARFMGARCYLVTFKKVDPLFTIDLSNPAEPKVLGKLKIPGYSDYLHPYDENHLIGIGKETVEAEEGDFAWYQGLKISLFDVSNVTSPKEVGKIIVGDRGTDSPALWDHHAFLFDRKRSLLVIPVLEAKILREKYSGSIPPNTYGEYVFQGAYLFRVSPEEGITLIGRITHLEDQEELDQSGYYFSSKYTITRSLYVGDVIYTVSSGKIKANSLTDLSEISEVELD
ncbi:MAG: beta-propeller domain-containing protein [Crenarchaeota archaeon]|nr:beta-propeller domain-containing protein [Thermoproteota archaeon]